MPLKNQNIKSFLIDQKFVSGIGNIYANEILFLSKIKPTTYAMKLSKEDCKRIISFGGAYSNHLLALAAFGDIEGIATLGIVRGDELNKHSNKMLERCTELGMRLEFVSRSYYKSVKHQDGIINKKYDYFI